MPSTGSWGCCPFGADSVCCSNGYTCCPKGTKCQDKGGGYGVVTTCVAADVDDVTACVQRISSPQLIQTSVSAICCLHFLLCQLFKFAISLTSAICWYIPSFAHLSSSLLSQHHLGCWMCARLLYCTCVLVRAVLHSDSDSESDHEILLLLFSGSSTHRVPSRPSLLFVSLVQGALLEIR